MLNELKPCPFCGGVGKVKVCDIAKEMLEDSENGCDN
jgi:RecJ-like exonuclease